MREPEVVEFPKSPPTDEEQLRRIKTEAQRLANQSELERNFFLPQRAEAMGISVTILRDAVRALAREQSELRAAERLQQESQDQKRERDRHLAEKAVQRAERLAEKAALQKSKEKAKGFATIARLPVARHAEELDRLAQHIGEEAAGLHKEFEGFLGVGCGEVPGETEAWSEAVDTAVLLSEINAKISRYVALQPHQLAAATLWVTHCWLYDHNVPIHSPILAGTSAEPDSGKTTLIAVAGHLTPRYSLNIEMTGPSLYRHVDRVKPTLMIDEADDLFARRSDLKHIINAGWTRGAKIPRQVSIGGTLQTVYFDPFTPKAIAMLGRNLPQATRTRCIELRMLPKRPSQRVEAFSQVDDPEFAILRRKLARWAADNAAVLKQAKPTMPPGLNNRSAANWVTLLAISEIAGEPWQIAAYDAAERLSRSGRRPSEGVQLLTAFNELFAAGKKVITSESVVAHLRRDPTSIWADFNRGGPVTQRQVAHLLDGFDIQPMTIHPTGRSDHSPRGYKLEQFTEAFARYLLADPHIRTPKPRTTKTKPKSLKSRKRANSRK
jgi:Protein of unknown function (DUF3631)